MFWNSSSVTVFTTFVVCSETTFASSWQSPTTSQTLTIALLKLHPQEYLHPMLPAGDSWQYFGPSGHHRQISLVNVLSPLDEDEVRVPSVSRWGFQRWCSSDYHRLSRPKMTVGIASFALPGVHLELLSVPQA